MIESTFSGKRIAVTRPRAQAKELQRAIEERGAQCVIVPLIEITQPDDEGFAFEQAMRNIHEYEWVVCTSANGALRVAPYLSTGATCPKLAAVGDPAARWCAFCVTATCVQMMLPRTRQSIACLLIYK